MLGHITDDNVDQPRSIKVAGHEEAGVALGGGEDDVGWEEELWDIRYRE